MNSQLCNDGQTRHRYVGRVSYDGSNYFGWQEQPQQRIRTIQGNLNRRLSKRFNRPIKVTGASRTDQGVHAQGQAFHFDLFDHEVLTDFKHLEFSLNRMLPTNIRVFNITTAPWGDHRQVRAGELFHATGSAIAKRYIYRYCTHDYVDPLRRNYYSHFYHKADWDVFHDSLQLYVGTHNFSSFANKAEVIQREYEEKKFVEYDPIRTIYSIDHIDEGKGYYRIEVFLESALYKMVRNLIGSSLWTARGVFTMSELEALIHEAPGRNANCAKPAPPEGLTLDHVFYDHY